MEILFNQNDVQSITKAEEETFAMYVPVFELYSKKFNRYGARLVSGISRDTVCTYRSFVTCKILDHNGAVVESKDHDMFMDFAWPLAYSTNGCVTVFADIDDDTIDLLQASEEYFQNPY